MSPRELSRKLQDGHQRLIPGRKPHGTAESSVWDRLQIVDQNIWTLEPSRDCSVCEHFLTGVRADVLPSA